MPLINIPSLCVCGDFLCPIPYGICHCGCGNKTNFRSGKPFKFLLSHSRIIPPIQHAAPFKIEGSYCRIIPLTQGQYTIVLAEDYPWISRWKWCAMRVKSSFYAVRGMKVEGKSRLILMHRQLLGLTRDDNEEGDHKNHNTLDNRRFVDGIGNIRIATHQQNAYNTVRRSDNASGFKGVDFHVANNAYRATITENGRQIHLGHCHNPHDAHALYVAEAAKTRRGFNHSG